jgi:hypothetical protein
MDILPENDGFSPDFLSYNQDVAYEDQVLPSPTEASPTLPLADRIGRNKVYLLSETNVTRGSKVRV